MGAGLRHALGQDVLREDSNSPGAAQVLQRTAAIAPVCSNPANGEVAEVSQQCMRVPLSGSGLERLVISPPRGVGTVQAQDYLQWARGGLEADGGDQVEHHLGVHYPPRQDSGCRQHMRLTDDEEQSGDGRSEAQSTVEACAEERSDGCKHVDGVRTGLDQDDVSNEQTSTPGRQDRQDQMPDLGWTADVRGPALKN